MDDAQVPADIDVLRRWAADRVGAVASMTLGSLTPVRGGTVSGEIGRVDLRVSLTDGTARSVPLVFKRLSPVGSGGVGAGNELAALHAIRRIPHRLAALPDLIDEGEHVRGPWMLTPFYPGRSDHPDGVPAGAMEALAQVHVAYLDRENELPGLEPTDRDYWRDLCGNARAQVEAAIAIESHPVLESAHRSLTRRAEDERFLRALELLPRTLVHGDIHPGNVLVDRTRATIVDWGCARLGPPMLDLANVTRPGLAPFATYLHGWERLAGSPADPRLTTLGFHLATVYIETFYLGANPDQGRPQSWRHLSAKIDRAETALDRLGRMLSER